MRGYKRSMIKIAVIDSGLDSEHSFWGNHLKEFYDVNKGGVERQSVPQDSNGHGTACVYIINRCIQEYELYIYRVFDENLATKTEYLIRALEHCKICRPDIINLSLGTLKDDDRLQKVCEELDDLGCILIAAASEDLFIKTWPAGYKSVIKVTGDTQKKEMQYAAEEENQLELFLYSGPQRVAWKDGKYSIAYGNSFACAKATGEIARIIHITKSKKKQLLLEYIKETYEKRVKAEIFSGPKIDYSRVKKAVIYPFNKEMHSIFRFREHLPFEIEKIIDLPFLGNVKKDSGEVIGEEDSKIIIESNFDAAIDDTIDTVILGDLSELSRIYKKDLVKKYSGIAFKKGKTVISIELLKEDTYKELKKISKEYHCVFQCLNDFIPKQITDIKYGMGTDKPVISVLGTGPKAGKFTVQLQLKYALEKVGYRVSNIATEPHGFLFGLNTIPLGNYNLLEYIPVDKQIDAIKALIIQVTQTENPDIIFTGGQSGVVPFSSEINVDFNVLSSIITILSSKPDLVILCIRPEDDVLYIMRTIQAIEAFGYGKVAMCAMTSLSRDVKKKKGISYEIKKYYKGQEISDKIQYFEQKLNLPVINILQEEDIVKCIKIIQDKFS